MFYACSAILCLSRLQVRCSWTEAESAGRYSEERGEVCRGEAERAVGKDPAAAGETGVLTGKRPSPHTVSDKVRTTSFIYLASIVFNTTPHTSVGLCRRHRLLMMIQVYFVRAVLQNPLVIPQNTVKFTACCALPLWGANIIIKFKIMSQSVCGGPYPAIV